MSQNISEQLFQTIDTIISKRLEEVVFDETIQCTVVQRVSNDSNEYEVKNNSVIYKAIAKDGEEYKKNDNVCVSFLKNSDEKIILGKYTLSQEGALEYKNPFDNFVIDKTMLLIHSEDIDKQPAIILSTNISDDTPNAKSIDLTPTGNQSSSLKGYDFMGLEFGINVSNLPSRTTGDWAIGIILLDKNNNPLHTMYENNTMTPYLLSSDEIYGNPYALTANFVQRKLFHFPHSLQLSKIHQIRLALYQSGNFSDIGKLIIENFQMTFGYDVNKYLDKAVHLYVEGEYNGVYTYTDHITVNGLAKPDIRALLIDQTNKKVLNTLPEGQSLRWYQHVINEPGDEYGGGYWKYIENDGLILSSNKYMLNMDRPNSQIKAVLCEDRPSISFNVDTSITVVFDDRRKEEIYKDNTFSLSEADKNDQYIIYQDDDITRFTYWDQINSEWYYPTGSDASKNIWDWPTNESWLANRYSKDTRVGTIAAVINLQENVNLRSSAAINYYQYKGESIWEYINIYETEKTIIETSVPFVFENKRNEIMDKEGVIYIQPENGQTFLALYDQGQIINTNNYSLKLEVFPTSGIWPNEKPHFVQWSIRSNNNTLLKGLALEPDAQKYFSSYPNTPEESNTNTAIYCYFKETYSQIGASPVNNVIDCVVDGYTASISLSFSELSTQGTNFIFKIEPIERDYLDNSVSKDSIAFKAILTTSDGIALKPEDYNLKWRWKQGRSFIDTTAIPDVQSSLLSSPTYTPYTREDFEAWCPGITALNFDASQYSEPERYTEYNQIILRHLQDCEAYAQAIAIFQGETIPYISFSYNDNPDQILLTQERAFCGANFYNNELIIDLGGYRDDVLFYSKRVTLYAVYVDNSNSIEDEDKWIFITNSEHQAKGYPQNLAGPNSTIRGTKEEALQDLLKQEGYLTANGVYQNLDRLESNSSNFQIVYYEDYLPCYGYGFWVNEDRAYNNHILEASCEVRPLYADTKSLSNNTKVILTAEYPIAVSDLDIPKPEGIFELSWNSDGELLTPIEDNQYTVYNSNSLWHILNPNKDASLSDIKHENIDQNGTQIINGKQYLVLEKNNYFLNANNVTISCYDNVQRAIVWQQPLTTSILQYSVEATNKWSGTSVYIDNEEHSVMATLIGAGKKDAKTNLFTGILMGDFSNNNYGTISTNERETGLYGFYQGKSMFGVSALTGNAFFKGHVETATGSIAGWNFNKIANAGNQSDYAIYATTEIQKAPNSIDKNDTNIYNYTAIIRPPGNDLNQGVFYIAKNWGLNNVSYPFVVKGDGSVVASISNTLNTVVPANEGANYFSSQSHEIIVGYFAPFLGVGLHGGDGPDEQKKDVVGLLIRGRYSGPINKETGKVEALGPKGADAKIYPELLVGMTSLGAINDIGLEEGETNWSTFPSRRFENYIMSRYNEGLRIGALIGRMWTATRDSQGNFAGNVCKMLPARLVLSASTVYNANAPSALSRGSYIQLTGITQTSGGNFTDDSEILFQANTYKFGTKKLQFNANGTVTWSF